MDFRFLPVGDDLSDDEYRVALSVYERHLQEVDLETAGDLRRYFAHDFFHDAVIQSLGFDTSMRTLEMQLVVDPWCLGGPLGPDIEGPPLAFRCTFEGDRKSVV